MGNLGDFDATTVEPDEGFTPIPAGQYTAVITGSEMKKTNAGNGEYLSLTFQIIEGQYENRLIWTNLNIKNPNETAVKIAKGELSAICRAVDVLKPQDSSELHDIPLLINIKVARRKDTGDLRSEIKGYKPINGSAPQPAKASASGDATPPWEK